MAFDAYEYDDLEQSERLRQWLRRYGASLILAIVLVLAATLGYGQWRKYQAGQTLRAASLYWQMRQAELDHQEAAADVLTGLLTKGYAKTAYAVFASAAQAQRLVQAKDYPAALDALRWAQRHAPNATLKLVFRLRIARVLLAQGQAAQALSALDGVPAAYAGISGELRGDAQLRLGHPNQAREAYQTALKALDPELPQFNVVKLKLADLAVAGKSGT